VRAVLDPNVLISALLSPVGAPAQLLIAWRGGSFELIVSPALVAELRRALNYPKLRKRIPTADAEAFLMWLQGAAILAIDPDEGPPVHAPDPGDDYLIALARSEEAMLVTGDRHLLGLAEQLPIFAARDFLEQLDKG